MPFRSRFIYSFFFLFLLGSFFRSFDFSSSSLFLILTIIYFFCVVLFRCPVADCVYICTHVCNIFFAILSSHSAFFSFSVHSARRFVTSFQLLAWEDEKKNVEKANAKRYVCVYGAITCTREHTQFFIINIFHFTLILRCRRFYVSPGFFFLLFERRRCNRHRDACAYETGWLSRGGENSRNNTTNATPEWEFASSNWCHRPVHIFFIKNIICLATFFFIQFFHFARSFGRAEFVPLLVCYLLGRSKTNIFFLLSRRCLCATAIARASLVWRKRIKWTQTRKRKNVGKTLREMVSDIDWNGLEVSRRPTNVERENEINCPKKTGGSGKTKQKNNNVDVQVLTNATIPSSSNGATMEKPTTRATKRKKSLHLNEKERKWWNLLILNFV